METGILPTGTLNIPIDEDLVTELSDGETGFIIARFKQAAGK